MYKMKGQIWTTEIYMGLHLNMIEKYKVQN